MTPCTSARYRLAQSLQLTSLFEPAMNAFGMAAGIDQEVRIPGDPDSYRDNRSQVEETERSGLD